MFSNKLVLYDKFETVNARRSARDSLNQGEGSNRNRRIASVSARSGMTSAKEKVVIRIL